jgi:hypothetical protein
MRKYGTVAILIGMFVSLPAMAGGYYLCQDPRTGKKTGQDSPCPSGKALGSYAPVSSQEQKAREESARQSKREFERLHPGTYRAEEYMTEEEYADYLVQRKALEAERKKQEEQQAVQDALRRSERAEQRAIEAERAARAAEAKATAAAEEAGKNRMLYPRHLPPYPPQYPPRPPRARNCDRGDCPDEQDQRTNKGGAKPSVGTTGPCTQVGNTIRCP